MYEMPHFQVRGGADPQAIAAIMGAVMQMLAEERSSKAMAPPRNVPSAWIRSGRRRVVASPRTPLTQLSERALSESQIVG